jgi:hypothetical protein
MFLDISFYYLSFVKSYILKESNHSEVISRFVLQQHKLLHEMRIYNKMFNYFFNCFYKLHIVCFKGFESAKKNSNKSRKLKLQNF